MKLLILYLAVMFVGYFIGSKLRNSERNFSWTGKIQLAAIVLMVFTMGSRIGSDKSIISSLSTIGITAFIATVLIMAGSVGGMMAARKLMGFNKEGIRKDD